MRFTPSTYTRLGQDKDYMVKAMDSLTRINHGQNATMEVVGDKVILNGSKIIPLADYQKQAVDMQSHLAERPELEGYYQQRQQRVEQAERQSQPNMIEKSPDEMMQEQAQAYMKANSGRRDLASSKQDGISNQTSRKTNLPSEQ